MEKLEHKAKLLHTKGDWFREGLQIFSNIAGRTKIAEVVSFKTMGLSESMEAESEANAKLIEAAPDLLGAALLAYVKLTSSGEANCDFTAKLLFDAIMKATQ
jgi:hypothetical protein